MKSRKTPSTKREEMETYRVLKLGRTFKSKGQRLRAAQHGLYQVLGGDDPCRPHIRVLRSRYREVRLIVMRDLLEKARNQHLNISAEQLITQLTGRVEILAYERLAGEAREAARLEMHFLEKYGRHLTPQEKSAFGAGWKEALGVEPLAKGEPHRRSVLDEVLGSIQSRQKENPSRYRTAWATVVGPEAARHSELQRVDTATGTVYFRCLNSALAYQLQRQPGLAKKLGEALGLPVKMLKNC